MWKDNYQLADIVVILPQILSTNIQIACIQARVIYISVCKRSHSGFSHTSCVLANTKIEARRENNTINQILGVEGLSILLRLPDKFYM